MSRGGFVSRGGRGAFGGRGGSGRGGYHQRETGPPAEVIEIGTFLHACENEMVCAARQGTVPHFGAQIFLSNKTPIGRVDEVFGPINSHFFTIKPAEGIQATSFKPGDTFYISSDKTIPLARFLPQPKVLGARRVTKRPKVAGGFGGGRGGMRGGRGGGPARGGSFGGRGARGGGGMRGRGGFSRGGAGAGASFRGGGGGGGFGRGRGRGGFSGFGSRGH